MNRRFLLFLLMFAAASSGTSAENLLKDPSFESTQPRDRWGYVFTDWQGWKYEGDCQFDIGLVARTGNHSCLLKAGSSPKIRVCQNHELGPGRYRITAFLRGLDIGRGTWNMTTEFMFNGQYFQLDRNGTFGWTQLTYVTDLKEATTTGPSFGLMAPGRLWIDDVSLERVDTDTPLTEKPVLGPQEQSIEPPQPLDASAVRCRECEYRNLPTWSACYACGAKIEVDDHRHTGPALQQIASFEQDNPFSGGHVVAEHASEGTKTLRIDRSYVVMDASQNWSDMDFLKADLYSPANTPTKLYIEIRDKATTDYWTRVNYNTVVPPGASTLLLPIRQLYVGEKSRPGRMLMLGDITRLVFSIGDQPPAPLYVDNIRLERDDSPEQVRFEGLYAFDLGTDVSPVMDGFTQITPATRYSAGRGYGLKDARVWRSYDVLQPEPLYQDFICLESGGLAVDLPNGKYRVWMNLDNPSGFWGEYQVYQQRSVLAEGEPVVTDTMNFEQFREKYFRFWNVEDLPDENTFDKYQQVYYQEKTFDVDVTDGQLNIEFRGVNWACSVSAVVVYPVAEAEAGARFLQYVTQKRRFYFDNYFKRILHSAEGNEVQPTTRDRERGYVLFRRNWMQPVFYNDTPREGEIDKPLEAEAFAGELEPLTFSLFPLRDLGQVQLTVSDLQAAQGTIPASAIDVGYVVYRLSRVTMEGTVYTIRPRQIMPSAKSEMPQGITRRVHLTIKTPSAAGPGIYRGTVTLQPEHGASSTIPIQLQVFPGELDAMDVPVGPWGHSIGIPWSGAEASTFNRQMMLASLKKMREYGFTACSGIPVIQYRGFRDGQPQLDAGQADQQMQLLKELGFQATVSYGVGIRGLNAYYQDTAAMQSAGFQQYDEFVQAIFTAVQQHADQAGWIRVYYNLGDEPIGDDLVRSAENAEAYHRAFSSAPPWFTAASSYTGSDPEDPHFRLSKALHVANWNGHSEASVRLLQDAGGKWAFYNGGNRWTLGTYMFKAVQQFDMQFRLSWHWNAVAGDPYYALDCREDDYAWCNATPDGRLIPSVEFEQLREGLDDYRRLLTLTRLLRERPDDPAAEKARSLVTDRLQAFRLGQRDHDALFGPEDWLSYRQQLNRAIGALHQ